MPRPNHVVVKLGGSLLDWEALREAFGAWLAQQPAIPHLVILGGGRLADVFREYEPLHQLDLTAAHWLCVRTMQVNLHFAQSLWSEARLIYSVAEIESTHQLYLFDSYHYLHQQEPNLPGKKLPRDWSVTSDSIAARLAQTSQAQELVLLKSCLPPLGSSIVEASQADYVDRYFPYVARDLPTVRFVNLRAPDFSQIRYFHGSSGQESLNCP